MVWADLNIQGNKAFVKSIGVLALPTVQFYAGNGVKTDTFPCGPSKVPILKRKLVTLVNEYVDANTKQLKSVVAGDDVVQVGVDTATTKTYNETHGFPGAAETPTKTEDDVSAGAGAGVVAPVTPPLVDDGETTTDEKEETLEQTLQQEKSMLRRIKYMSDLMDSDFDDVLSKAQLLTFEAGSIVMREGNMGRTFYIILDGEVEICQRTSFEDPLTTPPSYLGTVINQFTSKGDYFGERSLITGEPRAASIRASSKTRCLAIDMGDFPPESILSGNSNAWLADDKKSAIDDMNDKYGVALSDVSKLKSDQAISQSISASQVRGSANTPLPIAGVDNDDDDRVEEKFEDELSKLNVVEVDSSALGVGTETMVRLLARLKLIRSITQCFDYTVKYKLKFGDPGSRRRRNILVNVLTPMQRTYIEEAFILIDDDESEVINLMEIRRIMDTVGDDRTDKELMDVIETKDNFAPWQDKTKLITKEDFFGLMAESETYQLFIDTFETLDPNDSGFVRAQDLDRILCGVRDLISDDRKSIIDVDDMDMMVDYEQFSRMLLGTSLLP
jgi:CRP-like cAMP-binding protein/Ca2+-binding EF-hand superfamily protein